MISCSATISESEQLPEDGKITPKHLADGVGLILFYVKDAEDGGNISLRNLGGLLPGNTTLISEDDRTLHSLRCDNLKFSRCLCIAL